MTFTKSLLIAVSALTLATGAAFAGDESSGLHSLSESQEPMPLSSLETTDEEYFALANTGDAMDSEEVYYIVPADVVEIEEIWLLPSGDSEMPQG